MNHRSSLNPLHTSVCFSSVQESSPPPSKMKSPRHWLQIYAIYGMDEWQTLLFLLFHALLFSFLSFLLFIYFSPFSRFLHSALLPSYPISFSRYLAALLSSLSAISALSLLFASGNVFFSSVSLHWNVSQRMLAAVSDWSTVRTVLDVGCGRGILLNSVALMLKKQGSSGRVVGLDRRRKTTLATLRTAAIEGVQEYVTCREGDPRRLPFANNYFDVVVSGVYLHTVGKEYGHRTAAAAAERGKALAELVRVLKPGGVGVVWDLLSVPEYVERLREFRLEEIRVSERVTAYMVSSHIVSFRKPREGVGSLEALDWRGSIC